MSKNNSKQKEKPLAGILLKMACGFNIVADTDLYETDKEGRNLIDWVCLSEQIKENNNTIRNLTGEY